MQPEGNWKVLPAISWMSRYNRKTFSADLSAGFVVMLLLVPQSLAYAMLAGLPPQMGLYAAMFPLLLYALFGTSSALAVGPVAVVSLMLASAVGRVAEAGSSDYITATLTLAFISGLFLLAMGFLRLGFLANFLSHPVISGFISAAGVLIAASQLGYLVGVETNGSELMELLTGLFTASGIDPLSAGFGLGSLLALWWCRTALVRLLLRIGLPDSMALMLVRTSTVWVVVLATAICWWFGLDHEGLAVVGAIPSGLPVLTLPSLSLDYWQVLIGSALLISAVGFVESVSLAQAFAARRRQRIDPDQELIALGMANLSASVSGGYPVAGSLSRTGVNVDAGAVTPAAGIITAGFLFLLLPWAGPILYFLPVPTLAATIVIAVIGLIDLEMIQRTWRYSKSDFTAMATTVVVTLVAGVELGILSGVVISVLLYLFRTSRPHMAVVGQIQGTEHFRNVDRFDVVLSPRVVTIRVDGSLYFANARYLEDQIYKRVAGDCELRHLILMCPGINDIDASALESLEAINERLGSAGISLHLSEVKGPVMDKLKRTGFQQELTGNIYLSQYQAMLQLEPELTEKTVVS